MEQARQIDLDIFEKLLCCLPRNPDLLTWKIPLPLKYLKRAIRIEETCNHPPVIAPVVYEYALFCREKDRDGQAVWVFQGELLI